MPLIRQFMIIIMIFLLLMISTIAFSLKYLNKYQTMDADQALRNYSYIMANYVTESYASYENIAYSIAYDQTLQTWISSKTRIDQFESGRKLSSQLTKLAALNHYIYDIAVYGQSGRFLSLLGSQQDYQNIYQTWHRSDYSYQSAGVCSIHGHLCHVLLMPIYSNEADKSLSVQSSGMLLIAIDLDAMFSNTAQMADQYTPLILFTDADGDLIYGSIDAYHSLQNALPTELPVRAAQTIESGDAKYFYTVYSIPTIEHKLYLLMNQNFIQERIHQLSLRFVILLLAVSAVILILLVILYRPVIRSLSCMTEYMNKISEGDQRLSHQRLSLPPSLIASTEIRDINRALNKLLEETNRLNHRIFDNYTRLYRLQEENKNAEIAHLRSQINPHFLYNTLAMICGMASDGQNDKIIDAATALSRIFRYSIKGAPFVSLRQEMEIVKSYLSIQKERFDDRFTVYYEIQDGDEDCMIPKMILQPIAENAIVHGLEQRRGGELVIGTSRQGKTLSIYVSDTGCGMDQDHLKRLQEQILNVYSSASTSENGTNNSDSAGESALHGIIPDNTSSSGHIGLRNVNMRLVLYYGPEYHLRIDSESGVGTTVEIRIPTDSTAPALYGTESVESSSAEESSYFFSINKKGKQYVPGDHH